MSAKHPEAEGQMVDVSSKAVTFREATASGTVRIGPQALAAVTDRTLPKGDALEAARIAGIMAAKRTPDLIPLCHPIALTAVEVACVPVEGGVEITATVKATERTGVEMEALTAVSVAALTLYDMVKGQDRGAEITDVRLESKSGGRSGDWERPSD